MMIFVGFYTVILPFTNGPYSATLTDYLGTVEQNVKVCQDYWWRILLYINNFYACYNILWYLALDMQFYVIAPIFLVALYIHVAFGLALIVLLCVVSVWYVYSITYWLDIPATMVGEYAMFSGATKINDFFSEYYEKPWARVPPYLVGIAVGYLIAYLQRKPPKFNWFIVVGGWIVALIAALLCVFGPYRYIKGDDNWK
ncbi:hypothetical protein OESDEN_17811 [Oesophagostomum dentatum]|uniref:Acyltransferase 3 domain-containing protein n=1 Tax=Oesophagostomum dentatum TaxID=61180 RepID=A0A0B1SH00_OESDE|nr:hypothetical protein OESDEN_17811 [Oesophagostomum dentatum]